MDKRKRDLKGVGLGLLNRFASSEAVDKLGLRKPAEKALYTASRASFGAATLATHQLKAMRRLLLAEDGSEHSGELFDLRPTEEQALMQDSARRFSEDLLRPAAPDAEAHREISEDVWQQAHTLGLATLSVPTELGGAGLRQHAVTSGLIAESLGWGDMGQACALLAPVGVANALALWGTPSQQMQYLAAFTQEAPPDAAFAVLDQKVAADPMRPSCVARKEDSEWVINGVKRLVPLGTFADLFIVSVDCAEIGPRLILISKNTPGVSRHPDDSMGLLGGSLGHLQLKEVRVHDDAILGGKESFRDAIHRARLMWCSLAVGCAQAVLDTVTPYVTERRAFGEPIAHRQSVAFAVANMATEVDAMRLMTWRALARCDQGLPFHREAVLAHRYCAEHAMDIASDGVQLFGGHGFVSEYPLERWYRDLRAVAMLEGGMLA